MKERQYLDDSSVSQDIKINQSVLNQQLDLYIYNPMQEQLALDEFSIKKIEKLLQAGANPNYQNEWGGSLIYEALSGYNVELLELVLKFGADVNLHCIRKRIANQVRNSESLFKLALEGKNTSLQISIDKYYQASMDGRELDGKKALRCYDLISEKFNIPTTYIISDETISNIYMNLYQKIKFEMNNKKDNMPILIILGETHNSVVSLLIETMVFLIGKQFNIKLMFT